jgi:purine nucleosidase
MDLRKIIMDTDMLGDDALALLLVKHSPELALEGITTVSGSVNIQDTTEYTLRVTELAGLTEVPVIPGMGRPVLRGGSDGCRECIECLTDLPPSRRTLGNAHAVDYLISTIMEAPGAITLLPTGPLTNIAMALLQEPQIIEHVQEVILMGGAALTPGNVTPVAEFNMHCDPEAAKIVFNAAWPITMVGLDVTLKTQLLLEDLKRARPDKGTIVEFAQCIINACWGRVLKPDGYAGFVMHDPLAIGVAIDKSLVKTREAKVDVATKDAIAAGQTLCDFKGTRRNVEVCLEVESERFIDLFIQRVLE